MPGLRLELHHLPGNEAQARIRRVVGGDIDHAESYLSDVVVSSATRRLARMNTGMNLAVD